MLVKQASQSSRSRRLFDVVPLTWRFWFSGSDGLVDDHALEHECRACGMLSGRVISDIKNWLAEMEAKYAGSAKSEARHKPMPPSLMGRVALGSYLKLFN